ncbi:YesL family protein [Gracilibacillus alcaliphilus]|uniref:YesL family protein n=1 Tax=Gracilibacillus alcaliphilus TaxID=1401441 RepID=UPI00195A3C0A|nr:YesL family protein [Gracilibacillus alcaliphilus]MBM7679065.1 putative membrane protein YesL [Gracilibacillus alcaliphilus]
MRNSFVGITEWITRFAYLNVLWIAFTLLGGIILGLFPATIAMFAITRQWVRKETDQPIFSSFWKTYKREFFRSNLLGVCFYVIGFIFYINVLLLSVIDSGIYDSVKIPVYFSMCVIGLIMLYVLPVYVHYDLRLLTIWKNAFFIMISHPLHNMIMVIASALSIYLLLQLPATLFFFSGSMVTYIIMVISYHAFTRIAIKKGEFA